MEALLFAIGAVLGYLLGYSVGRYDKDMKSYNDNLSDIYYNKPFDEDKYKTLTEL